MRHIQCFLRWHLPSLLSPSWLILPNSFQLKFFWVAGAWWWSHRESIVWKAHGTVEQLLGCLCWLTGSPHTMFLLPLVHALTGYSCTGGIFLFATWTLTSGVNSDWLLAFDPSGKWWEESFQMTGLTCLWLCLGKIKIAISICSWKWEKLEDGPFVIIFIKDLLCYFFP